MYTSYEFLADFNESESFFTNVDEFSDELFSKIDSCLQASFENDWLENFEIVNTLRVVNKFHSEYLKANLSNFLKFIAQSL